MTQTGQTHEQIVTSVKKVSDIIAEIAAAAREQSSGIEQVNKAVMEMDSMTQQNAALVEDLTAMMQRYRLSDAVVAGVAASAKEAVKISAAPTGERRGANRPFAASHKPGAKPAGKAPAAEAAVPRRKSAGNGADVEWEEF